MHQASNGLRIIDNEIVDVVIVNYVCNILSLVSSRRVTCVRLSVTLVSTRLCVAHPDIFVVTFKLD